MQLSVSRFLEANVEPLKDGYLVSLSGELDLASRDALVALLGDLLGSSVVLDLAGLSFLDAAGVGALVSAGDIAASRRQRLATVGATGHPKRVLDLLDPSEASAPDDSVGAGGR